MKLSPKLSVDRQPLTNASKSPKRRALGKQTKAPSRGKPPLRGSNPHLAQLMANRSLGTRLDWKVVHVGRSTKNIKNFGPPNAAATCVSSAYRTLGDSSSVLLVVPPTYQSVLPTHFLTP